MGLFSKDWQDSDEGKALAWVRRQSGDKRALAQAAMKAPSYNVKVAAVEQLESQELLKLVATSEEHTDSDVKSMAMRKISDQAFLADYASKGWAAAIESLGKDVSWFSLNRQEGGFKAEIGLLVKKKEKPIALLERLSALSGVQVENME